MPNSCSSSSIRLSCFSSTISISIFFHLPFKSLSGTRAFPNCSCIIAHKEDRRCPLCKKYRHLFRISWYTKTCQKNIHSYFFKKTSESIAKSRDLWYNCKQYSELLHTFGTFAIAIIGWKRTPHDFWSRNALQTHSLRHMLSQCGTVSRKTSSTDVPEKDCSNAVFFSFPA